MKIFNQGQAARVKKNAFDLSHERKLSCNMSELVPILCEEVIPGDTFRLNSEIMMRLAPLISPVMHRVNVYTHFFFVPNRLVWDNWQKFITGGERGLDSPVHPFFQIDSFAADKYAPGSLLDHLGYSSVDTVTTKKVNALPARAYNLIWNEYYRDQNLQDEVTILKSDGLDISTSLNILKRSWEKDYFTSALPNTQKGGDVRIPLDTQSAPIEVADNYSNGGKFYKVTDGTPAANGTPDLQNGWLEDSLDTKTFYFPNGTLKADLSNVNIATVEDLRRATRLQRWLERNARSGSRYIESILAHFGVVTPDYRLQRPEYLGGGKTPVVISEVLQTSSTDATTPQGNLAGHGIAVGNTHTFQKSFNEHGFVIGILSVLPKTAYMQGMRRYHLRNDKFDYFWPEFAQLGEQPVYDIELYNNKSGDNRDVFGYQSRYCEYKYIPSTVHGDFKDTLKFWHLSREFASEPQLNNEFIEADNIERIFAVDDEGATDKLWIQVYHNFKAIRPIPYFNSPTL